VVRDRIELSTFRFSVGHSSPASRRARTRTLRPHIGTRAGPRPEDRLPPATRWPAGHPVTPAARPGMTHRDGQNMRRRTKASISPNIFMVASGISGFRRRADYQFRAVPMPMHIRRCQFPEALETQPISSRDSILLGRSRSSVSPKWCAITIEPQGPGTAGVRD
jgi:hypothetical protein